MEAYFLSNVFELHNDVHDSIEMVKEAAIDRFRLDQNPPSPLSSFPKHAHSLPFFSHHVVGRNDLPKRVSHSSNGIGLLRVLIF